MPSALPLTLALPHPENLPAAPPAFVVKLLLALRRFLLRLANGLLPGELRVFEELTGVGRGICVATAARLGLAEALTEGPLSSATLAERLGCDPDALRRFLRGLAHIEMLRLLPDGRFAGTPMLFALRGDKLPSFRDFALYWGTPSNLAAWSDLERTLRTGKNAFERVHGASVWDWFDAHPEERDTFAAAMRNFTLVEAPGIARAYPFGELKTLCDVGGGSGALLTEILKAHPALQAILVDAPGVLARSRPLLEGAGLGARVKLEPGSFFAQVPKGADAYLLKNILHDWDDARSAQILANCRAAMAPGQKLLLVESVLVDDPVKCLGVLPDLHMMVVCCEGRERTRPEFEALLRDAGFAPGRAFELAGQTWVLEGVAA